MQLETEKDFSIAITLLQKRISELKEYDALNMNASYPPELKALEDRIKRSLERIFGSAPAI